LPSAFNGSAVAEAFLFPFPLRGAEIAWMGTETGMTDTKTNMATDLLLLLTLSTLWGASYTLIKVGVETISPVTFIAVRTLVAGLILVAALRLRGLKLPTDRQT
jgi:hypothetical protein